MKAKATLADLISRPVLKELAGDRSFERGVAYFRNGAVERLVSHKDRITARVVGTEVYTVKLWPDEHDLGWDCTCPIGLDGEFCKHVVATGLAWLAAGSESGKETSSEINAIRKFLEASDKPALVEMLTEHACENEELADRLLIAAQRRGLSDTGAIKEAIRKAFALREFVDYRDMPKVTSRVAPVPELLRELSNQDAKAAMELTSDAMRRGLDLLGRSDDSDGRLGDILSEIAEIHRNAAGRAGLAPRALAKNLFELQLADGYDFFVLDDYLPALGKEGYAAYRGIAAQAWKQVPALAPGSREDRYEKQRSQVTEIMTTLARRDGNVEGLIEVLKRDLSEPHAYLEISRILGDAKRHDEALKWAEEGRRMFARESDNGLEDFLVAEYHRRGRHEDGIALRWARFVKNPYLRSYQELKESADRSQSWKAWRERALPAVRQAQGNKKPVSSVPYWISGGASLIVEIFLWEGDLVAALREARSNGCGTQQWLQLAKALETDHPVEAVAIYQERIGPIINLTNNQAYDQAAGLLRRISALMVRNGKSAGFGPYLDTLRVQYKAKRNFMQRLEVVAAARSGSKIGKHQASTGKPSSAAD